MRLGIPRAVIMLKKDEAFKSTRAKLRPIESATVPVRRTGWEFHYAALTALLQRGCEYSNFRTESGGFAPVLVAPELGAPARGGARPSAGTLGS
jgi:hypothetical protein